jgi:signal transduction histidine kinase
VDNLIRNAVRHTPSDGTVTVTGGQDERGGGWTADGTRGGVGLAIVRGLVEAHRGEMAVANIDQG